MSLPIKKVYVNSRYKTIDSVSDSNFKFELPYVLTMPSNAIFYITDVCIPNLFKTIAQNENDKLYVEIIAEDQGIFTTSSVRIEHTITIPPGNYTELAFSQAIDQQLRTIGSIGSTYDSNNNLCYISTWSSNTRFRILTDDEVMGIGLLTSPNSANEILNNIVSPSPTYDQNNGMTINRLRLQPIHNIYITSPNLGSFDTVSNFSNNIIKQVPVTSDYGYMIVDRLVSFADYLNCGCATLKTLEFHMRDGRGNYVNLYNNHVSFTIVFDTK